MLTEKLKTIKNPIAKNWFFILLVLFIIGFFITPERSYHRNGYYLLLFLPAIILFLRDSSLRKNSIEIPFILVLVFLLYTSLSLAWSEYKTWEDLYDAMRYTLLILSFFLVIDLAFRNKKWRVDDLLWWSMIGISIAALITIITYYTNDSFPSSRIEGVSPYLSITQGGNLFGLFAIIGLCFLVHKDKLQKLHYSLQILTIISILILCSYIIFSQTRGSIVAFIVTSSVLLLLNKKYKIFIGLLIASTLTISFIEFSDSIRGFFDRGLGTRPYIWAESLRMIAEKPFFGYGISTNLTIDIGFKEYGGPHNLVLSLLLKYGIVGFGLWCYITAYAFYHSVNTSKSTGDWTLTIMFLYSIIAWMFTDRSLISSPNLAWLIYWLPLGLIFFTNLFKYTNQTSLPRNQTT